MPDAVAAQGLTYWRDDRIVVDHLEFRVPQGTHLALVGRRGAGKTATLRMLATILEPATGTALVDGYDVQEEPRRVAASIGYVDESTRPVRGDWRPWPYLKYWARLSGLRASEIRRQAGTLLEALLAPPYHGEPISDLPPAQRRRLEIVRALLGEPPVLLLDDPTLGWDLVAKQDLWDDLQIVLEEQDTTLVLGTEDASEAWTLADRAAVLAGARLAYVGPFEDLPQAPTVHERLVRTIRGLPGGSP